MNNWRFLLVVLGWLAPCSAFQPVLRSARASTAVRAEIATGSSSSVDVKSMPGVTNPGTHCCRVAAAAAAAAANAPANATAATAPPSTSSPGYRTQPLEYCTTATAPTATATATATATTTATHTTDSRLLRPVWHLRGR